jgi:tetratricopeptide (TPR) repeat protein
MVLLKLGRNREAIATLRAAAHLEVRTPALYEALGVAYCVDGNFRRAAVAFKTTLSLTPWAPNAIHGLAQSLFELKQTDEAMALLVGYLEKKPQDNKAKELLAKTYAARGQYRSAIAQLIQVWGDITETDSSLLRRVNVANNIGAYYLDNGEKQQAEQWFVKAITIGPNTSSIPYNNLARIYLRNREIPRAFEILRRAQSRCGDDPDTRSVLASCFERVGSYDDAIAQVKPIVESGRATADIYAQLGALLTEGKGEYESALQVLKEASRRFSDHAIVANNLAYLYLLIGDAHSARPILETSMQRLEDEWMHPGSKVCLTATYGLLKIVEGDFSEGMRLYRRAEKLCSQLGLKEMANIAVQKMHLELARAYVRNHDYQHAREHVREGLAIRDGKIAYEQHLQALKKRLLQVREDTAQ